MQLVEGFTFLVHQQTWHPTAEDLACYSRVQQHQLVQLNMRGWRPYIIGRTEDRGGEVRVCDGGLQVHPVDRIDQDAHVTGCMLCQLGNSTGGWIITLVHQGLEELMELRSQSLGSDSGPVVGCMSWCSSCRVVVTQEAVV